MYSVGIFIYEPQSISRKNIVQVILNVQYCKEEIIKLSYTPTFISPSIRLQGYN